MKCFQGYFEWMRIRILSVLLECILQVPIFWLGNYTTKRAFVSKLMSGVQVFYSFFLFATLLYYKRKYMQN